MGWRLRGDWILLANNRRGLRKAIIILRGDTKRSIEMRWDKVVPTIPVIVPRKRRVGNERGSSGKGEVKRIGRWPYEEKERYRNVYGTFPLPFLVMTLLPFKSVNGLGVTLKSLRTIPYPVVTGIYLLQYLDYIYRSMECWKYMGQPSLLFIFIFKWCQNLRLN